MYVYTHTHTQIHTHTHTHTHTNTMEYYSVIKKNKIVPFAEIWMDLDNYTLWSQKEKNKYYIRSFKSEI